MWEAEEWHVQHVGWMLQQTKPKHVCGGKKVMYIRAIYIAPAVVASAAEAEYAALFMAARDAVDIRNILYSMNSR